MKIAFATFLALITVTFSAYHAEPAEIGNQAVKREVFMRRQFSEGRISEIALAVSPSGQKQLIILGLKEGLILHEDDAKIEEFAHRTYGSPRMLQFPGESPLLYCRGEGFGPVYLADFTGKMLWEIPRPSGRIAHATLGPNGNFYLGTSRGSKILSRDGKILKEVSENITAIECFPGAPLVTVSHRGLSEQSLEIRDEQLQVIKTLRLKNPEEVGAVTSIVMFGWPNKGALCYTTTEDFVCINSNGLESHRISLPGGHARARACVVHAMDRSSCLAVLANYRKIKWRSKLFILSPDFRTVHETNLPSSKAISALKWKSEQERLFVGVGSTGVDVFTIFDTKPAK